MYRRICDNNSSLFNVCRVDIATNATPSHIVTFTRNKKEGMKRMYREFLTRVALIKTSPWSEVTASHSYNIYYIYKCSERDVSLSLLKKQRRKKVNARVR